MRGQLVMLANQTSTRDHRIRANERKGAVWTRLSWDACARVVRFRALLKQSRSRLLDLGYGHGSQLCIGNA